MPWQQSIEEMIKTVKSAAVFVGSSGIGPWQQIEYQSHIQQLVGRKSPVIPVLLTGCDRKPELPTFLTIMTLVDFRNEESNPMEKLAWGITGDRFDIPPSNPQGATTGSL